MDDSGELDLQIKLLLIFVLALHSSPLSHVVLVHHPLGTRNGTMGHKDFDFYFFRRGKNYPALKERLALLVLVGVISYRSTKLSCHGGGLSCAYWAASSLISPLVWQLLIPGICTRAHTVAAPIHMLRAA